MPEVKLVYEITIGQLIIITLALYTLYKALPHLREIFVILAEHQLLVTDYAERKGVTEKDVANLALAEVAIRQSPATRRKR